MYQYRSKRNELMGLAKAHPNVDYDYYVAENNNMIMDENHNDERMNEDGIQDSLIDHMKGFIKHSIGSKMLEIVDELLTAYGITSSSSNVSHNHNLHSKLLSSSAFPKRAGNVPYIYLN
jgi:hypothetical protein